ncbi:zinc ribbon domain-containing protein [Staphylococcus caprae]|uniref:Membrane-associated protein n=1 Tax=Staphylococcus caprae TaxID=29380 RepID=A0ABM7FUX0_9STAP|nr:MULTISPECIES: zinc-ribbon domain-containing protein [Staphylococcus]EES41878.1 TcaA protein [Staphylococcus caprae M23864:W1]MBN6826127.1 zinc-ribbon domain-containing protein [Staphylococcus caprae]MBU5272238.1 zinc-ribbon domain-containing protein [Staphylococcus caprae]MBX5317389.1 zinc-ribbon domain-containing protein [Staphylococcus caprae]MBX5324051.1 zinc-ribbon domain-containing protein [Staphylococcus caprae]
MKQCPNCGQTVSDDNNQCPKCGQSLPKNNKAKQTSSHSFNDNATNLKLRRIVPLGIIFFILILIVILFFLLKNFNSPEAQTKILVNAVDNNDTQKVATVLSTKDNKVDPDEAKEYIKYIKSEVGMKSFKSDIKETVSKLNKNNSSVASYIQTRSGQDVLRISKNGTRYLFFDNMSFTAPTKQPIIKPKEKTKYEFKAGGKSKTVIADAHKNTPLGNFIPGNYELPAKKTTQNGTFNGNLNFDFRDSSSETVEASEDFDQAYLNIKLKGASKLSDSSEKVKINDREMSYSNSKEYGPYPKTKDITISATGKAKGRTFKSETKTISADDLKDNTKVTLEFESDKISSYVEKKEKEENSLKNKLTQFFTGYSTAINTAFDINDFDFISSYYKKNSSIYKQMKNNFLTQTKVSMISPQVLSASRSGDKIKTTIQQIDLTGNYVNKDYELEIDSDNSNMQLTKADDDE